MKLNETARLNLRFYIEKNEVVYQSCDGLISISNDANRDNRKNLLLDFDHESGFMQYSKEHDIIREGFETIGKWSTDDDILILFETASIVVCLPRKMAFENNIVEAKWVQ